MGFFVAAGLAGSALASFDLALVLDSGQNVVHRYDAESGVYLGNFGGGTLSSVRGIAVDKASNTAFVSHLNGFSAWDYNTGFFKFYNDIASAFVGDIDVTSAGRLLLAGASPSTLAIRVMSNLTNGAGVASFSTSGAGGPFTSAVDGLNGNYFVVNPATGEVTRFDQATGSVISITTAPGLVGTSKGAGDGTGFVALRSDGRAVRNAYGSTGASVSFLLQNPFTSAVEFDFGHAGEGWGLGVNANGTRLQRYARSSGGTGSFYDPLGPGRTLSQVTTPAGMAIVTAPEPGTLIALGVGAAALLRRRRGR